MNIGEPFNPWKLFAGALIPEALLRGSLPRLAILVFGQLKRYSGADGKCFPSHARLAGDLNCSQRSIRRSMQALVEAGLIRVTPSEGGRRSKTYEFLWTNQWKTRQLLLGERPELAGPLARNGRSHLEENQLKESHVSSSSGFPPVGVSVENGIRADSVAETVHPGHSENTQALRPKAGAVAISGPSRPDTATPTTDHAWSLKIAQQIERAAIQKQMPGSHPPNGSLKD